MTRLFLVATSIMLLVACTTTSPTTQHKEAEKPFFDASIVQSFIPEKTTQEEIRKALGEPYPDPLKTPERWTYMYTYQKQIIFTFDNGTLTGKQWSKEFGIGKGNEKKSSAHGW